jgi:hypothetical protein
LQEEWDEGLMTGHLSGVLGSGRSKKRAPVIPVNAITVLLLDFVLPYRAK